MFKYFFIRFIAVVVIPCLFLLALEFGLRIAGTGHSTRIYVETKENDTVTYSDNNKFGWQFFPPQIARCLGPFNLPKEKPENTFRIFVLGASAALGVPNPEYSFGRILEHLLDEQYEGIDFEVTTLAMPAINSHVVRKVIQDSAKLNPDLYLVYLGNNEVAGPYGAGTVFSGFIPNHQLIQASISAKRTYLGQFMKTTLSNLAPNPELDQGWRGLEMFLDKQVRAHDPKLESVFEYFESNLQYIAKRASSQEVPIIFSTVISNWQDCAPFASLHRENISEQELSDWKLAFEAGVQAEEAGDLSTALKAYNDALKIDNEFAELHFRMARCFQQMNEAQAAKESYGQALFYDTLRLRSEARTNQTIRNVAHNHESPWVHSIDAEKVFEDNSTDNILGNEHLLEHVHLNFSGNYLLAQTFYEKIEEILSDAIADRKKPDAQLPTITQCKERFVYDAYSEYFLMVNLFSATLTCPPFTNQIYHETEISSYKNELTKRQYGLNRESITTSLNSLEKQIQLYPKDWELRIAFARIILNYTTDYQIAYDVCFEVTKQLPLSHVAHNILGELAMKMSSWELAKNHFKKSAEIYPYAVDAWTQAGKAYHQIGDIESAIEHYKKAIEIKPYNVFAYTSWIQTLMSEDRTEEALAVCNQAIQAIPDSAQTYYNLGFIHYSQDNIPLAIEALKKAIELDPSYVLPQQLLTSIREQSTPVADSREKH